MFNTCFYGVICKTLILICQVANQFVIVTNTCMILKELIIIIVNLKGQLKSRNVKLMLFNSVFLVDAKLDGYGLLKGK